MDRFTEKFKDGRNILRKGISDIFYIGFGRFFDGDAVDRLAEYEDLQEQGRLLKLPCVVGDTAYQNMLERDNENKRKLRYKTFKEKVVGFSYYSHSLYIQVQAEDEDKPREVPSSLLGEKLFFVESEAETALKELKER